MDYVFVFLGEFGYELLNWQGVIRKFAATLPASDRIVCCSRAQLYPLYETAAAYVDISKAPLFQKSRACMYDALFQEEGAYWRQRVFRLRLRRQLQTFIAAELDGRGASPESRGRLSRFPSGSSRPRRRFIFSHDRTEINGCVFGYDGRLRANGALEGDIYDALDASNNLYARIAVDDLIRPEIEARLGWSLDEPFVLCQSRQRVTKLVRSTDTVPKETLIERLAQQSRVVLLTFNTNRQFDSFSQFNRAGNTSAYAATTFVEQACLIHFARRCVFFTEGDFGSHIYVPPFMGRDVFSVAPQSVYDIGTTPIEFWNQNVFRFGGRIIPKVSDQVLKDAPSCERFAHEILV